MNGVSFQYSRASLQANGPQLFECSWLHSKQSFSLHWVVRIWSESNIDFVVCQLEALTKRNLAFILSNAALLLNLWIPVELAAQWLGGSIFKPTADHGLAAWDLYTNWGHWGGHPGAWARRTPPTAYRHLHLAISNNTPDPMLACVLRNHFMA